MGLFKTQGIHTVSIDEQTGIQALERIAGDKLVRVGQIARLEYEYKRHGTIGLFGNLHIATGKILSPLLRATRREEDFVENIDHLVRTAPTASWRFIVDNLNTHFSKSLVRYVASSCGLDQGPGREGPSRHSEVSCNASRVSRRRISPTPFHLHPEAHVLAEPDRDLVRCVTEQADASWLVHFDRRPEPPDPRLH